MYFLEVTSHPERQGAEVGSVEDRNQALAAERADVSRMEQALQHVRDALADYAREYWDRNRQEQLAQERDDLGRTR